MSDTPPCFVQRSAFPFALVVATTGFHDATSFQSLKHPLKTPEVQSRWAATQRLHLYRCIYVYPTKRSTSLNLALYFHPEVSIK